MSTCWSGSLISRLQTFELLPLYLEHLYSFMYVSNQHCRYPAKKCLLHTEKALLCIRIIIPIKLQVIIHQDTIENVSIRDLQGNTLYIDTVPSTQTAPAAECM